MKRTLILLMVITFLGCNRLKSGRVFVYNRTLSECENGFKVAYASTALDSIETASLFKLLDTSTRYNPAVEGELFTNQLVINGVDTISFFVVRPATIDETLLYRNDGDSYFDTLKVIDDDSDNSSPSTIWYYLFKNRYYLMQDDSIIDLLYEYEHEMSNSRVVTNDSCGSVH